MAHLLALEAVAIWDWVIDDTIDHGDLDDE